MIITLVFFNITHKTAAQSTVGMQAFYTINIRNSFHNIYVLAWPTLTPVQSELRFCIYVYNIYHWQPENEYWVTLIKVLS